MQNFPNSRIVYGHNFELMPCFRSSLEIDALLVFGICKMLLLEIYICLWTIFWQAKRIAYTYNSCIDRITYKTRHIFLIWSNNNALCFPYFVTFVKCSSSVCSTGNLSKPNPLIRSEEKKHKVLLVTYTNNTAYAMKCKE